MRGEIPTSRDYRHNRCNETTVVDGGEFITLSNPFNGNPRTFCCHCNEAFPLEDFRWADTGERISETLARHRARAPSWAHAFLSDTGCLVSVFMGLTTGAALGFAAMAALGWQGPLGWGMIVLCGFGGLIGGMMFFGGVLAPMVKRSVYGIEDWRELR